MATPAASPQVASTIGLKNVVIAPLLTDTDEGHNYGELQMMAGAIEASITPDNADPDQQYADDAEFSVLYPDPELSFKTKMADIPLIIQEKLFGKIFRRRLYQLEGMLLKVLRNKLTHLAVMHGSLQVVTSARLPGIRQKLCRNHKLLSEDSFLRKYSVIRKDLKVLNKDLIHAVWPPSF